MQSLLARPDDLADHLGLVAEVAPYAAAMVRVALGELPEFDVLLPEARRPLLAKRLAAVEGPGHRRLAAAGALACLNRRAEAFRMAAALELVRLREGLAPGFDPVEAGLVLELLAALAPPGSEVQVSWNEWLPAVEVLDDVDLLAQALDGFPSVRGGDESALPFSLLRVLGDVAVHAELAAVERDAAERAAVERDAVVPRVNGATAQGLGADPGEPEAPPLPPTGWGDEEPWERLGPDDVDRVLRLPGPGEPPLRGREELRTAWCEEAPGPASARYSRLADRVRTAYGMDLLNRGRGVYARLR